MIDPPTVAAITISIVIVVFEIPLEAAEVAFAVSVALASEASEVPVTVAVKTDVDNCWVEDDVSSSGAWVNWRVASEVELEEVEVVLEDVLDVRVTVEEVVVEVDVVEDVEDV